jgi:cytochrome c553
MKNFCVLVIAALFIAAPLSLWSTQNVDGKSLFMSKCSTCHGADGAGQRVLKIPPIKGTSLTARQIVQYLTKGDSNNKMHSTRVSDLNPEQVQAITEFIKSLQ